MDHIQITGSSPKSYLPQKAAVPEHPERAAREEAREDRAKAREEARTARATFG